MYEYTCISSPLVTPIVEVTSFVFASFNLLERGATKLCPMSAAVVAEQVWSLSHASGHY